MPQRSAKRYHLILLCAVAAFSFSVLGGLGHLAYQGVKNRDGLRELVFWSAAQTELEYWRLLQSVDRYALGDRDVSRDDVKLRLDILWSRIALYDDGPAGRSLNMIPGTRDLIVALSGTLRGVEPLLNRLPRGDGPAYRDLRTQLSAHTVPLRVLSQRTNRFEQAKTVDAYQRMVRTQQALIFLMAGVLVSGAALITLLVRETGRARKFAVEAVQSRRVAVRNGEYILKIVETVDDAIVALDPDGIIQQINTAGETMFGLPANALAGTNFLSLLTDESRSVYLEHTARDRGADPATAHERLDVEGRRGDGATFPAEISVGEISEGDRRTYVVVIRDMTEQRQTQVQLLHSQKMDALGKLTGEVAHEFNNLLTAIGGFAHMGQRSLDDKERVERCLSEVIRAADQAAALTGQMLAFGRKQALKPQVARVSAVTRDLGALLQPLISEKIELHVERGHEDTHIFVDPAQLSQALLNLAINATHAMPDGGTLTIRSGVVQADAPRHPAAKPGQFVTLAVSDSGTGIDPETAEHIFEPFFSTKEEGKGTGLGLSMVHGMVEQSGGWIDLDSELGVGTTFTIFLPLAQPADPDSATVQRDWAPHQAQCCEGTVLLVEDKRAVREIAAVILQDLGYEVIQAGDGQEASEIFAARNGKIDVLVSDIAMPRKDGFALARELREIVPDLKIVLMSGHAMRDTVDEAGVGDDVAFLQKPFDPRDLADLVCQTLNRQIPNP